jgi:arylsulfatase A-like enzyme
MFLGLTASSLGDDQPNPTTNRPNIVVLFADDGGYADFGFQPNARPDLAKLTPRIDSIAAAGVRCSQAYVTACVCSPSRAGLMTGRYQQRFGHDANLPPTFPGGLPLTETFGPQRLQQLGYHSGLIGKWHLGYPEAYRPNQRGFDSFYGLLQGSRSYHPYENPEPFRVIRDNDTPTPEQGYITDRLGDAACQYIEAHHDQPFYLFVSFTAPHGPLEPRKGYNDEERLQHVQPEKRRKLAGLIVALDDNVGKILDTLDAHNLSDNTLVVFTNDNGGPGPNKTYADNSPLKGFKGSLDEGGIRVPWSIRYPGVVAPGTVIDQPVSTLDLLPTFVEVAGGTVDPSWNLDGLSLLPLLKNPQAQLATRPLYWRRNGPGGPIAIRDQDWKLVLLRNAPDKTPKLYNLATDIGEQHDVAAENPAVVEQLLAKLTDWEAELSVPLWESNYGKKPKQKKKAASRG